MPNTSATGGYLLPSLAPAPLEGQALADFIQAIFVNITGMPGTTFFPRWQFSDPPNLPAAGTDWAAFGIVRRSNNKFAYVKHAPAQGTNPAHDEYQTHEELTYLVSFYGPNAELNAAVLRDGLYIPQNLSVLNTQNAGLIDTGDLRIVPSLEKERWLYRVDLQVRIRRQIVRWYAILDLASASGTVNNEFYTTPILALQPTGDMSIGENSDRVSAIGTVT